jgi:hypothetical protein
MGKAFGRIVRLMPVMADSAIVRQRCRENTKCSAFVFKTMVSGKETGLYLVTALTTIQITIPRPVPGVFQLGFLQTNPGINQFIIPHQPRSNRQYR